MVQGTCFGCGAEGCKRKCTRCSAVWFCTATCQKKHLDAHKYYCRTIAHPKQWSPSSVVVSPFVSEASSSASSLSSSSSSTMARAPVMDSYSNGCILLFRGNITTPSGEFMPKEMYEQQEKKRKKLQQAILSPKFGNDTAVAAINVSKRERILEQLAMTLYTQKLSSTSGNASKDHGTDDDDNEGSDDIVDDAESLGTDFTYRYIICIGSSLLSELSSSRKSLASKQLAMFKEACQYWTKQGGNFIVLPSEEDDYLLPTLLSPQPSTPRQWTEDPEDDGRRGHHHNAKSLFWASWFDQPDWAIGPRVRTDYACFAPIRNITGMLDQPRRHFSRQNSKDLRPTPPTRSSTYLEDTHQASHWFSHPTRGTEGRELTVLFPFCYNAHAKLLAGVDPKDSLYGTTMASKNYNSVYIISGRPVESGLCAIAHSRYGQGTVSYFGDVEWEHETMQILGSLLEQNYCYGNSNE